MPQCYLSVAAGELGVEAMGCDLQLRVGGNGFPGSRGLGRRLREWEDSALLLVFPEDQSPQDIHYRAKVEMGGLPGLWLHLLLSEMGTLRPREEQRLDQSPPPPHPHPTPIPHLGIWDLHT